MTPTATISRERVYPLPARPGPAWYWVYAVRIDGDGDVYKGRGLSWARDLARRKGATLIVEDWKNYRAKGE